MTSGFGKLFNWTLKHGYVIAYVLAAIMAIEAISLIYYYMYPYH
jgi:hypothetical protein